MVILFNFLKNHQWFSTGAALFYIPTSNAQVGFYSHILTNTCYFPFFKLITDLVGMKWCLVVLICISPMKDMKFRTLFFEEPADIDCLMLGKIEGRRRLTKDDTIVEWHHRFSGREFEQTPGDSEGQGRLVCYSLWGHKELDTTE